MSVADGPRTERAVPLPWAATSGTWQVGVGPGAVLLHGVSDRRAAALPLAGTDDRQPPASVRALADALVRGRGSMVAPLAVSPRGAAPTASGPVGRSGVRVRGVGPLARRLRRSLGGPDAQGTAGPVTEVIVHQHVVPPEVALAAARAGQPVLPVVVQPRRVVVGPVSTVSGPCLHCLDLHRRDRDPHWALVATHLGHPVEQVHPAPVPEALQAAAEGLVVLLVDTVRSGRPVQPGLSHEVGPQPPHVVLRRWTTHPRCPWHRGVTA